MTVLIHKWDVLVPCRLTKYSKSIWWKEDMTFFILLGRKVGSYIWLLNNRHSYSNEPLWFGSVDRGQWGRGFEFMSSVLQCLNSFAPLLCPEFVFWARQVGLTSQFCNLLTAWVILGLGTQSLIISISEVWWELLLVSVSGFPTICGPRYSHTLAGTYQQALYGACLTANASSLDTPTSSGCMDSCRHLHRYAWTHVLCVS